MFNFTHFISLLFTQALLTFNTVYKTRNNLKKTEVQTIKVDHKPRLNGNRIKTNTRVNK